MANEPELYITQVISIFVNYDKDLVRKAVAPSGIPYQYKPYLPTTGEIKQWLDGEAARVHRLAAYKALPPPVYHRDPPKPFEPNLFVPEDVPEYSLVKAFVETAEKRHWRHEKDHVCYDGRLADGYWIPKEWWDQRHSLDAKRWGGGQITKGYRGPEINKPLTEEQKKAALESAALAGKEMAGMKLSPAALATLSQETQTPRPDISDTAPTDQIPF